MHRVFGLSERVLVNGFERCCISQQDAKSWNMFRAVPLLWTCAFPIDLYLEKTTERHKLIRALKWWVASLSTGAAAC